MSITDPEAREAISGLLGFDLIGDLTEAFRGTDALEEEIAKLSAEYPEQADLLYHGFGLCNPGDIDPYTDAAYRAHCRELLTRLAKGEDTRPGTDAEICCLSSRASLVAPLTETGAGVYSRAFATVFPAQYEEIWGELTGHYEALHGGEIDRLTGEARRKLAKPKRRLGKDYTCTGMHHGEEVACRFLPGTLFGTDEL